MRLTPAAVIAAAASIALAACSNDQNGSPLRVVAPGARSADAIPTTCDITTINQLGKAYFTSSRDPVFTLITSLKNDLKNFGIGSQTTADVFNILKRVATVRLTSSAGGATDGANFVDAVLGCASFASSIPSTFNASLSLGSGIFAVSPTASVEAMANSSVPPATRWGAEPGSAGWPSGTYLVYGYPKAPSFDVTIDGFELGTLPPDQINPGNTGTNPIDVGICKKTTVFDNNNKPVAANLLVHNGNEILPLVKLAFCDTPFTVSATTSWFGALASRLTAYFSATTAFAQDGGDTYIGGLPSGWSPIQPQTFTASNVALSYSQPPLDTKTSATVTVKVLATPAATTTLPPLNVRLTIFGNNGTPAFFRYLGNSVDHIDVAAVPNGDGTATATFTYGYTKAGGYTLIATGYLGGGIVATAGALSPLFNVQNK